MPLCKLSNLLKITKFKKRDTQQCHLTLKVVPHSSLVPTYAHTKYMTNWLTSRANKNTVNTAMHAWSGFHTHWCSEWCGRERDQKWTGISSDSYLFDFLKYWLFFGHKTLHTVSQHRSCMACKSKFLQLLSIYELWTIDSHAANKVLFNKVKPHCSFLGPKYLSNNPKGQWMIFYYHLSPLEPISFFKLERNFFWQTITSQLPDVIMANVFTSHMGLFNFKLLKIK